MIPRLHLTCVVTWTCSRFVSLPLWGKNRRWLVCQAVAAAVAGWQMVSSSVTKPCLHYRLLIKLCLAWCPWWSGLTLVRSSIFQVTLSHTGPTQGHFFCWEMCHKVWECNRSASLSLCAKILCLWLLIHAFLEDQPLLQCLQFSDWSVQMLWLTQTWQHATYLSNFFL